VVKLLMHHIKWVDRSEAITAHQRLWLFALLARLEKPLDSDTSSTLRSLLRHCTYERAKLVEASDPELASLNMLITIIGHFFGQKGPGEM